MSGVLETAPPVATPWDRAESLRRRLSDPGRPSYAARLEALDRLSDALLERDARHDIPGVAFLAAFLRSSNLAGLVARELAHPQALDGFVAIDARKSLRILPRGIVCQWIAGNVPLLGMFSWAFSALAGNVTVIRLSTRQPDFVSPLLTRLAAASAAGSRMAEDTLVVRFERDNDAEHRRMSALADVRIAWGGHESVEAIAALPARWDAETVVFGPRVSLAVVDPAVATDGALSRLVTDIVYFDQLACSSPQRVFVKGRSGDPGFDAFVDRFTSTFARQSRSTPREPLNFSETYRIQLDRTRVLVEGGTLRCDGQTNWTVAVSKAPLASVTCMNRFVEIVPFDAIDAIAGWIPPHIQTVVSLVDADDLARLSEAAAWKGACRFPRPGDGNGFENPWDGVPLLSRLTRWVTRTDVR
jgi:hypothetical protein